MKRNDKLMILTLFNGVLLWGCSEPTARSTAKVDTSKVEKIAGTELNRVILSEKAAQRLDIKTSAAQIEAVVPTTSVSSHTEQATTTAQVANPLQHLVVPYSSVLYDVHGKTWIYTSPAPLTYIRQQVTIDYIDGDRAVLSEGPEVGTAVVTVGVAELYGSDTGVGK